MTNGMGTVEREARDDTDRYPLPEASTDSLALESERPLRAAIYTRISNDDAKTGTGVARQRTECYALAKSRRFNVVAYEEDNSKSATKRNAKRPAWDRVKALAESGEIDVILGWHPDRISRNDELEVLIRLVERTRVLVVTCMSGDYDLTTADGLLRARIINDVARHETDRKSERTQLWLDSRSSAGIRNGGGCRMYGYERDRVTPVPEEIAAIRWAADRLLDGASLGMVARDMPVGPAGKAKAWHRATLVQLLTRPSIAGLMVRNVRGMTRSGTQGRTGATELVPIAADFTAALDRETWLRLCAVLKDPARKHKRPATAYLLTGGLLLDEHGQRLYGWRKANGVEVYKSYRPNEDYGSGLPSVSINRENLDRLVTETLLARADDMRLIAQSNKRASALPALRHSLGEEMAAVTQAREAGAMPLSIFLAESARLAERERKLAEAEQTERRAGIGLSVPDYMSRPGALRKAWPAMALERKRAVLAHEIASVLISPTPEAKRGKREFMPERVAVRWQDGTETTWREDGTPNEAPDTMTDERITLAVSRTLAAHLVEEREAS